jgi:hypothetical protein
MDTRQEIMLLMMSLAMLTLLGTRQLQIRWRNRSAISAIGAVWGDWSARFNLFSWRGYINWLALASLLLCCILVINALPRPSLVVLILSYGSIIFYSWPMKIVIAEKGILYQHEVIYWEDIAVWEWTERAGLSYLTIWLRDSARKISIPVPDRERQGIGRLIKRTVHVPRPGTRTLYQA